jgi:hypothetical protein
MVYFLLRLRSIQVFDMKRLIQQLVPKGCAEAYKLLEWIGKEHDDKGTDLRKVTFGDYVGKKEIRNVLGDETLKKSIEFYSKRIPKTGVCYGCGMNFECKYLKKCTRCNLAHYCGVECQRKEWPRHKIECNKYKKK